MNSEHPPFEEAWRRGISGYEAPLAEEDWQQMDALLDRAAPPAGPRYRRWWPGLLLVLTVMTVLTWIGLAPVAMAVPEEPAITGTTAAAPARSAGPVEADDPRPAPAARVAPPTTPLPRTGTIVIPGRDVTMPTLRPSLPASRPLPRRTWITPLLPLPVLPTVTSRGPTLSDVLEAAGKSLIVVPPDEDDPDKRIHNGLYPPIRRR